jgi:nucleolar protein 16
VLLLTCWNWRVFRLLTNGSIDLENLAAATSERQRHSSVGERWYLERLAKKYGDDMHKMALDRRLNPEQKTIGELKRAITKAGGLGVLRGDTS